MIKESVKKLTPYIPNTVPCTIKLDANEGSNYLFNEALDFRTEPLNLYPDSDALKLCNDLSQYLNVKPSQIMVGNGSSEMIELLIKTYVEKDEIVLGFEPSFSMYQVYTTLHGGNYRTVSAEDDLSFSIERLITRAKQLKPKLIILCSPNNPTGFTFSKAALEKVLKDTEALVLIDEAYGEFSHQESVVSMVDTYPKLMVTRTFSKAFGLAGARLGYLISNSQRTSELRRVKTPYNLNRLSQYLGVSALKRIDDVSVYVDGVIQRRKKLQQALMELGFNVYPSEANFLFIKAPIAQLYERLLENGILIRKFTGKWAQYYRITVGLENQNETLISVLKGMINDEKNA